MECIKDKEVLKNLDKLFYSLSKEHDEDFSVKLINDLIKEKIVPYMAINLRIGNSNKVETLYKHMQNIKAFKTIINANIISILLSSLLYTDSMRVAINIYNDMPFSKFSDKFNDEMLICVYRHGLMNPENKELCDGVIRRHVTRDLAIIRPFFFLRDNVELVEDYISKEKGTKEYIYTFCTDSDSSKILKKANKYYKEQNTEIVKLSFPAFKDNLNLIDITDTNVVEKIIDEVSTFSRWDFLPFIFENLKLSEKDWTYFRIGLYQGYYDKVFLTILFHLMEKNEIDPIILKSNKNRTLLCDHEIKDIFDKYNLSETFNVKTVNIQNKNRTKDICSLFHEFSRKNYQGVVEYMFISYPHVNNRFVRERDNVHDLIMNRGIINDSDIRVKWVAFVHFTNDMIEDLKTGDVILNKYNSYFAISQFVDPFIGIRFINDIYRDIAKIKTRKLLEEYKRLLMHLEKCKSDILKEVRYILCIDLPVDVDWKLPENPKLEDLFIELYQYSCYEENDDKLEAERVKDELKRKNFYKIHKEVCAAIDAYIPINDIKRVLRSKRVIA